MYRYCNNTWQWAVEVLKSDKDKGLKEIEIEDRRTKFGSNKIGSIKNKIIFRSLKECLRWYIIFALILTIVLFLNDYEIYGGTLLLLTIINLAFKLYINYEKLKKLNHFKGLNTANVRVIRDGIEKLIKAEELVNGDIVYFKKNTLISADLRIIEGKSIKVSEKNITGEEFLKEKFESRIEGSVLSIADMKNILLRGSIIKDGEGAGVVVSTGNNTELGKIIAHLNTTAISKKDYLKDAEKKLSLYQFSLTLVAMVMYFIFHMENRDIGYLLLPLYSVYIIPMILLLIAYVTTIKKAENLINPSVLLNIQDVEIAFLEDVGAFTEENMVVEKLFTDYDLVDLEGANYNKDINIKRLIDILLICNNSTYNINEDKGKGLIEEVGYLRFAGKKGAYKSIVDNRNKRKFEIPMDAEKRVLTVITKGKRGVRANCRGAVDEVLSRCKYIMINGVEKELTKEDKDRIRAIDYNLSIEGLLTEGTAYRSFSYEPSEGENIESNLVFVGIVGSKNPLVLDYVDRIEALRQNNILPIVFTSLNKISATALGMKLGIINTSNQVVSGVEIDNLSKDELLEVLGRVRVFSRVNSNVKRKVINLFHNEKYKVLSVGENISDLPSLCLSTVGVLTGQGAEKIKPLGDVFIENNLLSNLFRVIKKGQLFTASKDIYFKLFYMISLIQIFLINVNHLYYKEVFELKSIIITTLTFGIPMLILALNNEFESVKFKEIFISVGIILGAVLFTAYLLENELYSLNILGFSMVAWTIINGKSFVKKSKVNLVLIGLMIIIFLAGLAMSISYLGGIATIDVISLCIVGAIFVGIEWIVKKWVLLE